MKLLSCSLLLITWISLVSAQDFLRCRDNRSDCCDKHRFCSAWARQGECAKNPTWMPKNCQISCNTCGSASPTQRDQLIPRERPITDANGNGQCSNVIPVEIDARGSNNGGSAAVAARAIQMGCAQAQGPNDCSFAACFHTKYRTMDGTCNNLRISNIGAAFTPYARLLPADYADGFNAINGNRRPSARLLVTQLLRNNRNIPLQWNSMLMQWGQFLNHDITRNTFTFANHQCGRCPNQECADIITPEDTERKNCIAFKRTFPVCGTGMPNRAREQLNSNTAFIDGSPIYSSDSISLRALRTNNQALLIGSFELGRSFPRQMIVGDDRASIFYGLSAVHIVFFRLHNNLAQDLQNKNPHWNGDKTFQETRKIVGAIVQHITYTEFLPKLLGSFHQQLMTPYRGYNASVNPAILNEFAGSAYRLHGLIPDTFAMMDERYQQLNSIAFGSSVNQQQLAKSQLPRLLRGLMSTPAKSPQRYSFSASSFSDLATMNVQRGRDHGLRSYNDYRKLCNLQPMTFDNWPEATDSNVIDRVRQLYNNDPNAVDLTVGGMSEEPRDGDVIGPTFACIISEQFSRLRDGDRFYYENTGIFTADQVAAIKKSSLAWAFCQTEESLGRSNRDAFAIERGSNAVPCSAIEGLDTRPWQE